MIQDVNTVEQVASELQVTIRVVRRLLHDKKLAGIKVGGVYRIPRSAVEAYMAGEVVASGESVVVDKAQTEEEERVAGQLRVAQLKTDLVKQNRTLEEEMGLRDRPEQLDTREAEIDTREKALDVKEEAMTKLVETREEDYNTLLISVAEGVDTRVSDGMAEERVAMAEERVATAKVLKIYKEMYNKGVYWVDRFAYMVKAQGSYSDADKRAQEDAAARGKAMMEAVGFSSRLGERFNFENIDD